MQQTDSAGSAEPLDCIVIGGGPGGLQACIHLVLLDPERDTEGFKIVTKSSGESSIPGLFVLGSLRTGHSQAIISAGQGAEAAIWPHCFIRKPANSGICH